MSLTEQNLIDLKFKRENISPEESGDAYDWHYYVLEIGGEYGLDLISNASDKAKEDGWTVGLLNYNEFEYSDVYLLSNLINALKSGLINKEDER